MLYFKGNNIKEVIMKKKERQRQEMGIYVCGLILLGIGACCLVVSHFLHVDFSLSPCYFHKWTGFYCPGCGGTRAVKELLAGHLRASFIYHPAVPLAGALYLWFMISHTIEILSGGKLRTGMKYSDKYLYIILVLILIQCLVKNLAKLVWGVGIL